MVFEDVFSDTADAGAIELVGADLKTYNLAIGLDLLYHLEFVLLIYFRVSTRCVPQSVLRVFHTVRPTKTGPDEEFRTERPRSPFDRSRGDKFMGEKYPSRNITAKNTGYDPSATRGVFPSRNITPDPLL